jgi:hypothetical protein
MVSVDTFRNLALGLPDTDEHAHFHRKAFRVKKRIFATLHIEENRAMLVLSPVDQSVYCELDPDNIFPVPGGWGKQGCTLFDLKKTRTAIFKEALNIAYQTAVAKNRNKSKRK